jgi:hypothetical protein
MGDTELLEGYGDEILALPEVKLATGAVAAPATLPEPPTVWSGLVDLVDLRERLIPVLAQEIAGQRVKRERKQGAGLDHVAARTWLVQALTAYDVAMLPPTLANAANAGELAKLCTEHWELVYRQLLDLSKQRDMQGWHSSTLTFDGFDQQLRRLLLQTCASGTFALKRDSDTFVATTNKSFGQPVVW